MNLTKRERLIISRALFAFMKLYADDNGKREGIEVEHREVALLMGKIERCPVTDEPISH